MRDLCRLPRDTTKANLLNHDTISMSVFLTYRVAKMSASGGKTNCSEIGSKRLLPQDRTSRSSLDLIRDVCSYINFLTRVSIGSCHVRMANVGNGSVLAMQSLII